MRVLLQFVTPPYGCSYLPDRAARMEYEIVASLTPEEYQLRLENGWRRFGFSMFRPRCESCTSCQSLRVPVAGFSPNRSQRRSWKTNQDLRIEIAEPEVTSEKLDLYDRFHLHQVERVGWNEHQPKDPEDYAESFVYNPFPTEEWRYYLGDQLVGVGYVDLLPEAMSAIYFFHEPVEHHRSLGTFNVLSILASAQRRGIPYLYLGYYVESCRSLQYKGNFQPNELIQPAGNWEPFR